jgi:hypothetical protein
MRFVISFNISNRKVELEGALESKTMSKDEVAGELRYLLQLVRDVEANDKSHAVATLTARKASLVNLAETEEEGEGEEAKEGEGEEDKEEMDTFEKAVKEAQDKVDLAGEAVTTAEEALKTVKDNTDSTDE